MGIGFDVGVVRIENIDFNSMCCYVLPETCNLDLSISKNKEGIAADGLNGGSSSYCTSHGPWHLVSSSYLSSHHSSQCSRLSSWGGVGR